LADAIQLTEMISERARFLVGGDFRPGSVLQAERNCAQQMGHCPINLGEIEIAVHRIVSRQNANQDQHDQPHSFLAVVRAVSKTDAGAEAPTDRRLHSLADFERE